MNITGAGENEWLLCMEYVIYVRNHTAMKSLNWKTPLEVLTGITPNISIIYQMFYQAEVYFLINEGGFPSDSTEGIGLFVGFSENIEHGFTFKILTKDTKKVIGRSRIHLKSSGTNLRLEPRDIVKENIQNMEQQDGESENGQEAEWVPQVEEPVNSESATGQEAEWMDSESPTGQEAEWGVQPTIQITDCDIPGKVYTAEPDSSKGGQPYTDFR